MNHYYYYCYYNNHSIGSTSSIAAESAAAAARGERQRESKTTAFTCTTTLGIYAADHAARNTTLLPHRIIQLTLPACLSVYLSVSEPGHGDFPRRTWEKRKDHNSRWLYAVHSAEDSSPVVVHCDPTSRYCMPVMTKNRKKRFDESNASRTLDHRLHTVFCRVLLTVVYCLTSSFLFL